MCYNEKFDKIMPRRLLNNGMSTRIARPFNRGHYIEVFYNNHRRPSTLGCLSPVELDDSFLSTFAS
jgi:hypothetical protein